jgi:hypothetical protein
MCKIIDLTSNETPIHELFNALSSRKRSARIVTLLSLQRARYDVFYDVSRIQTATVTTS